MDSPDVRWFWGHLGATHTSGGRGQDEDGDDDGLFSWRMHLARQRHVATERQRQLDMLHQYRARREVQQQAREQLHAASAAQARREREAWEARGGSGAATGAEAGHVAAEACGAARDERLAYWMVFEERWDRLEGRWGGQQQEQQQPTEQLCGELPATAMTLDDIPWPEDTTGMLRCLMRLERDAPTSSSQGRTKATNPEAHPGEAGSCLSGGRGSGGGSELALLRRAYRRGARRWHPDRFRLGAVCLALPEGRQREEALQRAGALCQALNAQYAELERELGAGAGAVG